MVDVIMNVDMQKPTEKHRHFETASVSQILNISSNDMTKEIPSLILNLNFAA